MMRPVLILPLILISLTSSFEWTEATEKPGYVTVDRGRFLDPTGRNLTLRGINIGFSSLVASDGTATVAWRHEGAESFTNIHDWGYNCVRLVFYWSGIEPECGKYSEEFLKEIDQRIEWARENDLYVILDMHQDLWGLGVPGARGAPEWTLVDKTPEHVKGEKVWSEAYFTSPLVQTAFDNFWDNKPGPDGVGIQDRFAWVWKHLAERYKDDTTVIGFDLLNEPSTGSPVVEAFMAMTMKMLPKMVTERPGEISPDPVKLAGAVMAFAESDIELYKEWLAGGDESIARLDREKVAPMYDRVARAIREVNTNHLIFTSTTLCSNFGLQNGIQRIRDAEGNPDLKQVFSPHIYDDNIERIRFTYKRLVETARKLDTPMLVGEWGNLTNSDSIFQEDFIPSAMELSNLFDQTLASDTYWYYMSNLPEQDYYKSILQRPYPVAVCGEIMSYSFDRDTRRFECTWKEDPSIRSESIVYIPPVWFESGFQYDLSPSGLTEESEDGKYLVIENTGEEPLERRLVVKPAEE